MDHLRVFHDVARTLTTSLDLQEILLAIMDKMANFFGPERWSLLMIDTCKSDLYYAIAVGEDSESLKGLRVPLGQGVAGWVAATGNPLVVPNVALDPHWSAFARNHPDLKISSIACVPIRSGENTLGVIQLLNSKLDLMSEYSISFLRILCDYAAIAIQNARSVKLIEELSITDDCTRLLNSRRLYEMLAESVELRRDGRPIPFSLVFFDLDSFKVVNDTYGHLVGSRLLHEVGDFLLASIGAENAAFRYGGDEFVVLMPGMEKMQAAALTHSLCAGLRSHSFLTGEGHSLRLAASFGVATFPQDGDTMHAILRSADGMMYEVKNTTGNDVAVMGQARVLSVMKSVQPERRIVASR
jgi:diguanylate cyclase (GGDEF)-like protein